MPNRVRFGIAFLGMPIAGAVGDIPFAANVNLQHVEALLGIIGQVTSSNVVIDPFGALGASILSITNQHTPVPTAASHPSVGKTRIASGNQSGVSK